jgi:hypothetical protein
MNRRAVPWPGIFSRSPLVIAVAEGASNIVQPVYRAAASPAGGPHQGAFRVQPVYLFLHHPQEPAPDPFDLISPRALPDKVLPCPLERS